MNYAQANHEIKRLQIFGFVQQKQSTVDMLDIGESGSGSWCIYHH